MPSIEWPVIPNRLPHCQGQVCLTARHEVKPKKKKTGGNSYAGGTTLVNWTGLSNALSPVKPTVQGEP
jgi:hypothetical protein